MPVLNQTIKKLLTLPAEISNNFFKLFPEKKTSDGEWFCAADPLGARLGSGGGTINLLYEGHKKSRSSLKFSAWIESERRVILHAGGQSRRLPAYAPISKSLMPLPVFKWKRGQRIDQTLLDLQIPFLENLLKNAPSKLSNVIACGDVLVWTNMGNGAQHQVIPEADVVLVGLWSNPEQATSHGVFFCEKNNPQQLSFILQKPTIQEIQKYASSHFFLIDSGIWLLSSKAMITLAELCGWDDKLEDFSQGKCSYYDLYTDWGKCLSLICEKNHPSLDLQVAVLLLEHAEFLHFGNNIDVIKSSLFLQNAVIDQRTILHGKIKPHPKMFVQNACTEIPLLPTNHNLWIENSYLSSKWKINNHHIITGVPVNDYEITLPSGICLDIVPIKGKSESEDFNYCIRPYGIYDKFSGNVLTDHETKWMNKPLKDWALIRELGENFFSGLSNSPGWKNGSTIQNVSSTQSESDIQRLALFPVISKAAFQSENTLSLLKWMIDIEQVPDISKRKYLKKLWLELPKLSAEEIQVQVDVLKLFEQKKEFMLASITKLAKNYKNSIFFQIDLEHLSELMTANMYEVFPPVKEEDPCLYKIHQVMFSARFKQKRQLPYHEEEKNAFRLLKQEVVKDAYQQKVDPQLNVQKDQIVWGRSPLRVDLAGGWSDTPPYCFLEGGKVVNAAINMNGQQPVQVFIRPNDRFNITLNSIDLGVREEISSFEQLENHDIVGSPFSIPKAALCLAGFSPKFALYPYTSLTEALKCFGAGLEISVLSAVPAGSGAGTSSILGATILGTLADFCRLKWSSQEIGARTLILEQLLTTGGGWQDQYGGILPGIKFLETESGLKQRPTVKWLSDFILTKGENRERTLLFYTGLTRTAKSILAEIVKGMFLNSGRHLSIINEIKNHALATYETILTGDYEQLGIMVKKSWELNKLLDKGTNPPDIDKIISLVDDYLLGYKLLGAGGGGMMLMMAKDVQAASLVREKLKGFNSLSRWIDLTISTEGFQVTRS